MRWWLGVDRGRNSLTTRGAWVPIGRQKSRQGLGVHCSPKQIRDSGGEEEECKDRREYKVTKVEMYRVWRGAI